MGVKHLNKIVGAKPMILLYLSPGNEASITEFKAFGKLAQSYKDKARCFGVVRVYNRNMLYQLKRKVRKWKVNLPILLDWRGVLAYATLSRKAPSYAAIDKFGNLKLAHASSLNEEVVPNVTTLQALNSLVKKGTLSNYRAPGYHPNAYRWIGKPFPKTSFKGHGKSKSLTVGKPTKRPTLLVVWSPKCKHCKQALPKIQEHQRSQNVKANIVTLAYAPSENLQKQLSAFLNDKKLSLSVLRVSKKQLKALSIRSFPTYLVVSKSGKVKGVHFGGTPQPNVVIQHLLKAAK